MFEIMFMILKVNLVNDIVKFISAILSIIVLVLIQTEVRVRII